MSAVISGTNGLLQSYDYQVLTTGFSYTFAAGTQVLIIDPAGTLATGTITMPASPADGMTITISSDQQITALTMSGNGGTIVGPAVQLLPNQPLSWVYRTSNTSWYPVYGGAGRATALVSGTAVASTSGTSIDFTSIPSWVKRITVMLSGVSTNGTTNVVLQLGTGAGPTFVATGYNSPMLTTGVSTMNTQLGTIGFLLINPSGAGITASGTFVLTNLTGNTWTGLGSTGETSGTRMFLSSGSLALGAVLTAVRITINGTEIFDAGTINILYE